MTIGNPSQFKLNIAYFVIAAGIASAVGMAVILYRALVGVTP